MSSMENHPFLLSQHDLEQIFPPDRNVTGLKGSFEIALALGGTVSAGAYTGGVLDYLIEALDAWTAAKERGDAEAPTHTVVLHNIAGASGGALNGAIFLRAINWSFPHGRNSKNPFYSAWAGDNAASLAEMLRPGGDDSQPSRPAKLGRPTLFNTNAIEDQLAAGLAFKGDVLGANNSPKARSYVADPLVLTATIGNLTGIPYRLAMTGQSRLGHDMVAHADCVRFSLSVPGGTTQPPPDVPPELMDGYAYNLHQSSAFNWDVMGNAVLASAAFPIALDTRLVDRPARQLAYRVVVVPQDKGPPNQKIVQLLPVDWSGYDDKAERGIGGLAACVDGGTVDNEPIGIAHRDLAGYTAHNPRDAVSAKRAVILIDPFADPEKKPALPASLSKLLGGLLQLFVQQNRYKPEDLAFAGDETTYSRFLIAPVLHGTSGKTLLASGGLGGFFGFTSRELLRHDFDLGRYDAFLFLTRDFLFPPENVVFQPKAWSDAQKKLFTSDPLYTDSKPGSTTAGYLPMIPLMKALRDNPPAMPRLDVKKAFPDGYEDALRQQISKRLDHVFERLRADIPAIKKVWKPALALCWRFFIKSKLVDDCIEKINDEIKSYKDRFH